MSRLFLHFLIITALIGQVFTSSAKGLCMEESEHLNDGHVQFATEALHPEHSLNDSHSENHIDAHDDNNDCCADDCCTSTCPCALGACISIVLLTMSEYSVALEQQTTIRQFLELNVLTIPKPPNLRPPIAFI